MRLKIQMQIIGSDQVSKAVYATLDHQIIYRLQNHLMYLPLTECYFDSLLVIINREKDIPYIILIPRRISRQELTRLIFVEWITNYEKKSTKIKDKYNFKRLPSKDPLTKLSKQF